MRWFRPMVFVCILSASLAAAASDPFAQADVIETIGIARVAEEAGDAVLRAQLEQPAARQTTLIAARASAYAHAPEALVPALAKLACGRDPALAPEAAQALLRIAERLTPAELGAREALRHDLDHARRALACAEAAPAPRADIAWSLAQLAAALDVLLRP